MKRLNPSECMAGAKGKSQGNLIVAAVFLAVAIAYFFGRGLLPGSNPETTISPSAKRVPQSPSDDASFPPIPAETSNGEFIVRRVTPPGGALVPTDRGGIGRIGSQTLPTAPVVEETAAPGEVPIEIEADSTGMTPEETARALEAEMKRPPPELPDDLKAQLNQPPGELPDDLKAQLHAPPRELPEDIKKALKTPPRIVSLEEVNNPNYRRPDSAAASSSGAPEISETNPGR